VREHLLLKGNKEGEREKLLLSLLLDGISAMKFKNGNVRSNG
jgi:hypothetical protein